jgi:hypothetical protein
VGSLKKASQTQRTGHDSYQLTNITNERCRTDPSPLAVRNTNFRQHFNDPISIPKDLMHPDRGQQDGRYHIDVGPLPED